MNLLLLLPCVFLLLPLVVTLRDSHSFLGSVPRKFVPFNGEFIHKQNSSSSCIYILDKSEFFLH